MLQHQTYQKLQTLVACSACTLSLLLLVAVATWCVQECNNCRLLATGSPWLCLSACAVCKAFTSLTPRMPLLYSHASPLQCIPALARGTRGEACELPHSSCTDGKEGTLCTHGHAAASLFIQLIRRHPPRGTPIPNPPKANLKPANPCQPLLLRLRLRSGLGSSRQPTASHLIGPRGSYKGSRSTFTVSDEQALLTRGLVQHLPSPTSRRYFTVTTVTAPAGAQGDKQPLAPHPHHPCAHVPSRPLPGFLPPRVSPPREDSAWSCSRRPSTCP